MKITTRLAKTVMNTSRKNPPVVSTQLLINGKVVLDSVGQFSKSEMIERYSQQVPKQQILSEVFDARPAQSPLTCTEFNDFLKLVRPTKRVKVVQGRGYIYVTGEDVDRCFSQSLEVHSIVSLSFTRLLSDVDEKLAESAS